MRCCCDGNGRTSRKRGKALNNDDERARLGASALVARIAARPRFHKLRMSARGGAATARGRRRLSRPGGEVRALRVEKAPPEGRGGGEGFFGRTGGRGRTDDGRRTERMDGSVIEME